jgi:hypothetical protein
MISIVYWRVLTVAGMVKLAVKLEASIPAGNQRKSVERLISDSLQTEGSLESATYKREHIRNPALY